MHKQAVYVRPTLLGLFLHLHMVYLRMALREACLLAWVCQKAYALQQVALLHLAALSGAAYQEVPQIRTVHWHQVLPALVGSLVLVIIGLVYWATRAPA